MASFCVSYRSVSCVFKSFADDISYRCHLKVTFRLAAAGVQWAPYLQYWEVCATPEMLLIGMFGTVALALTVTIRELLVSMERPGMIHFPLGKTRS